MPSAIGSPTLVLVPTELERARLDLPGCSLTALCGFGPVAAAARTAAICAELRPARVFLVGIAGTYEPDAAPVGSALTFGRVTLDGIGADGDSPEALGFPQYPGSAGTGGEDRIGDVLDLGRTDDPTLVTVLSASSTAGQARERRDRHARAAAEDMEGFGVAAACVLSATPLVIVRGIANVAGERDRSRWRVDEALAAATALLARRIEEAA